MISARGPFKHRGGSRVAPEEFAFVCEGIFDLKNKRGHR